MLQKYSVRNKYNDLCNTWPEVCSHPSITAHSILIVPKVRTEIGKKAFRFSAPVGWNNLLTELNLQHLVPLTDFKDLVKTLEPRLSVCKCFI